MVISQIYFILTTRFQHDRLMADDMKIKQTIVTWLRLLGQEWTPAVPFLRGTVFLHVGVGEMLQKAQLLPAEPEWV